MKPPAKFKPKHDFYLLLLKHLQLITISSGAYMYLSHLHVSHSIESNMRYDLLLTKESKHEQCACKYLFALTLPKKRNL